VENGRIVVPRLDARLANIVSGRSRGVELLLQRRSANGLSGWIAYSYGTARRHDEETGLSCDSDFDQRHTVTVYGSMRLSQTLNVSLKYRYGSGFPVPGFYRSPAPGIYFLSDERNTLRPDGYGRLDLRANKAWLFRRLEADAVRRGAQRARPRERALQRPGRHRIPDGPRVPVHRHPVPPTAVAGSHRRLLTPASRPQSKAAPPSGGALRGGFQGGREHPS
jgi:hypothetical protein